MSKTSGLAITSLVLGILAFILIWIPVVGQILAILALVFGIMVLIKIKKDPTIEGKGMAIVGIVLGGIALLYALILLAGFMAYFGVLSPHRLITDNSNTLSNTPISENSAGSTSNTCVASTGTKCTVEHDDGTALNILFSNELGSNIVLDASKISSAFGCKASMICLSSNINCNEQTQTLLDGGQAIITLNSCPFKKGPNAVDLRIEYLNQRNGLNEVAQLNVVKNIN